MRSFGYDHTQVSALGLGCSRIGSFGNPMSHSDITLLFKRALDLGVTLFDTADIYGQGDSEQAIGHFLRQRRDDAFVISKVGKRFSAKMRLLRPVKPLLKPLLARSSAARARIKARRDGAIGQDFSPDYIRCAIDRSLLRLRFDAIDAVLLHSPSAVELMDPALQLALMTARKEGKIRHYGVACDDLSALEAALQMEGITLLEIPPDVLVGASATMQATIARHRIGIFLREVIRRRGDLVPCSAVREMVERPAVTCVIAGTTSIAHLEELAQTMEAGGGLV
jgi:aryl-alcohol dehydrogenase-like predicted oxidoreductase